MNSIELTRALHRKGYLSKEAAIKALKERDKLVKEALFRESLIFFKEAGIRDFLGKLRIGGKTPEAIGKAGNIKPGPGWTDVGANLTKILALAGLTSASAAGIHAIQGHHRDKKLQGEIADSYVQMKREFPRIQEMDQDKVRSHFEVLSRYAPSLAANPTVAGGFVSANVNRGMIDPAMIKTLAQAQETIDKVRGHHKPQGLPFSAATGLAQSAMAGAGG